MNSLREIVEQSPSMRSLAMHGLRQQDSPQPLAPARWDWSSVSRVLVVRLRSIGDTVLATPSFFALKRFLPHARIDVLVEDWVAPLLDNFPHADKVIAVNRRSVSSRGRVARELRAAGYDVVYNLHGGTTATFLTRATGAKHRVGYSTYQYARLHNHLSPPASVLWRREKTHSVEQQLALLGWTGVPVSDRPRTQLAIRPEVLASIDERLTASGLNPNQPFAMVHPAAAFATKQWAAAKFANVIDKLALRNLPVVVLVTPQELSIPDQLRSVAGTSFTTFSDLGLPEVIALASRARLFVGNDSGIAHIAAAVALPAVVIFGSSNRVHWRPWNSAPADIVYEDMPCQPCHGYFCEKFDQPECIIRVPVDRVLAAIDRVLSEPKC